MTARRVVYLGTPALAIGPLEALVGAGYDVATVVSAADTRRGRGSATSPSPVKARALEFGLTVTDDPDALLTLDPIPEVAVVVAYGRLIRPHLLAAFPFVNLHVSLLPRWRGAAPIERAILAGDEVTGVCVMQVTEGLDEGGVYARAETTIGDKTVADLRAELIGVGTDLLLAQLAHGFGDAEPQVGEVTYASKITPDERRLDWASTAAQGARVVRIGDAWTTVRGTRLKVHEARVASAPASLAPGQVAVIDGAVLVGCAAGALELVTVQVAGRSATDAAPWARNARLEPHDRLGS